MRVTPDEYLNIMERNAPKRHKYGVAERSDRTVDGIVFDSKKEARRYRELRMMERAHAISDLELQPVFELHAPSQHQLHDAKICEYRADFRYLVKATGEQIVEDVKGMRTAVYRLKKKWVEAEYGITITET